MRVNSLIMTKYSGILFLLVIFIVLFAIISTFSSKFYDKALLFSKDGYENLANAGEYPDSEDKPLLIDSYNFTGRKGVSANNNATNWWQYPIFKVGSYSQITNNLRYRKSPDDGSCIAPEFCGALYKDKHIASNVTKPLPPVQEDSMKKRVNYYHAM